MSADGRYVAVASDATNLVPGDTNGVRDVFVRDHQTGETVRASVGDDEAQADAPSSLPSISGDGRYVAFQSSASNLVLDDEDSLDEELPDVFVRDLFAGTTILVASGSNACQCSTDPSLSADGRIVAFEALGCLQNCASVVYVQDLVTGTVRPVSFPAIVSIFSGDSHEPSISGNGRYVAFSSDERNLPQGRGDDSGARDVFVHDLVNETTTRVSFDSGGGDADGNSQAPSISDDGRYVAFESSATDLTSGDTNGAPDAFVRDRSLGITERISVDSNELQATGRSAAPSISDDGRYVAFESEAGNLVSDDTNAATDAFVRDRAFGFTRRVSLKVFYAQANGSSSAVDLSGDGRYVGFQSDATNLVRDDTNNVTDGFTKFTLAPRPVATVGDTSIPRGTTETITITGSWLDPSLLQAWTSPSPGVTVDEIAVQNPNTTAVLTITVAANAQAGSRDLFVYNPGNAWNSGAGGGDVCSGCLTVT